MDCGVQYPYWVMQFDHRPDEVKEFTIGASVDKRSKAAVMAEIAKCDVVCANCHADRTHQRRIPPALRIERIVTTEEDDA